MYLWKELAVIYQLTNIFVYYYIFEGFVFPIMEAFSKTPVICLTGNYFFRIMKKLQLIH
jgi:hypothetical protein